MGISMLNKVLLATILHRRLLRVRDLFFMLWKPALVEAKDCILHSESDYLFIIARQSANNILPRNVLLAILLAFSHINCYGFQIKE